MHFRTLPAANSLRTGVSLVEMLVVVTIVGILVALSTTVVTSAMQFAGNLRSEIADVRTTMSLSNSNNIRPTRSVNTFINSHYIVMLSSNADPAVVAQRLSQALPIQVLEIFNTSFKGLSVAIPAEHVQAILTDPDVRFIEQDQNMVTAQTVAAQTGVRRIGADVSTTRAGDGVGLPISVNVTQTQMTGFQQQLTTTTPPTLSTVKPTVGFPFFSTVNGITNFGSSTIVKTTAPQGTGVVNVGIGGPVFGINVNLVVVDTGVAMHSDLFVIQDKSQQLTQAVTGNSSPTNFIDTNGHGTLMAGIAAARDNTVFTVGVAPGARIWACNAIANQIDEQQSVPGPPVAPAPAATALSVLIKAVDEISKMHAAAVVESDRPHVVYIGFTTNPVTPAAGLSLSTAIANLVNSGTIVVVPAGNSAVDAINVAPANCPRAITVGAMVDLNGAPTAVGILNTPNAPLVVPFMQSPAAFRPTNLGTFPYLDESLAPFSNRNTGVNTTVDLLAPGVDILSTRGGGTTGAGSTTTFCTGTSAAAAHVAGLAVLALDPNARMSENIANGRSIFNSLGFGNQIPAPVIPDAVDFLMKNLHEYPTFNDFYTGSANKLPNRVWNGPGLPLVSGPPSPIGIRVVSARLF